MYGPKAFELTVGKVSDHLQNEHFESHEQLMEIWHRELNFLGNIFPRIHMTYFQTLSDFTNHYFGILKQVISFAG